METEYYVSEELISVSTTETDIISQEQRELSRPAGNQQQLRKEVERVLKPYNTTAYSFLEYGAESMLRIEGIVNRVQEVFSTDSIVDGLSAVFSSLGGFVNSFFSSQSHQDHRDMEDIQEKLNHVMKQMEAVQEDNRKKTEELKQLREQISANNSRVGSPKAKPAPPPFPPNLDRYSQQAEQSIEQPHTIPSPVFRPANPPPIPASPQSPQSPQSPKQMALPPPIPTALPKKEHTFQRNPNLLTEIQQASKNVKLRKVPRNGDGTPIRRHNEGRDTNESENDIIRNRMIERIRMMEDEEPEEDVRWRESDIF